MKWILGFLSALMATVAFGAEPKQLIPTGPVAAKVMEVATSPRAEELTAKLEAAVANNAEWWQKFVADAPAGEPLPYDSRMGLTEAEHAEFLGLANTLTLRQADKKLLYFGWSSDTEVVLDGRGALPELSGLRIDLAADSVTTQFGVLVNRTEVNNTSPDSPTGPWSGVRWSLESGDPTFGVSAQFNMGRLAQSGEGILYFDAKEIRDGSITRTATYILFYPLPSAPTPPQVNRRPPPQPQIAHRPQNSRFNATCPEGIAGCSEDNQCTECHLSCGDYCQNTGEPYCGRKDCMTCPPGKSLSVLYEDGTGKCV